MRERILIVEDNKAIAKLISRKIEAALDYQVDVAYTFSEAKLFLKRYAYFLTLLDINLPDAPNGEVVDYVLEKGNRAIVLSANIDKEFRKKILQKNIIDYVNKSGVNDVNYIIQTIQRLKKNTNHKVLIVDQSMVFRKQMQSMLENMFFNVTAVAHGEEAINLLGEHTDVSLVLTDYQMPVVNGLELTIELRKKYKKDELNIIALSSNEDDEINAMFLKEGANDYIKKPFSKEEFSCRINNSIEALENIQIITNHANRDFLTGLYNRRFFFDNMNEYIKNMEFNTGQFAVAMIEIDHFKKINDTYGSDMGDKVIVALSEILRTSTNYRDLVSRFAGEEFCIVLKDIDQDSAIDTFEGIRKEIEDFSFRVDESTSIKFTVSIGMAIHNNSSFEDTISQADMMLYNAKNAGQNKLVFE